jgi:membrane protease YdiL (CAAX protease family)
MTTINFFGGPVPFIISIFILAIGEEIGWRGFLQPRLTELLGIKRALLLTGVVWVVWHYSFFLLAGGDNLGGNLLINALLFTVALVFVYAVIIGWLRAASGSLWPSVVWHATWNIVWIYGQVIFSVQRPGWSYVGNDSGVACLVVGAVIVFWIWRQLPTSTPTPRASLSS